MWNFYIICFLALNALAQTAEPEPAFDVADLKVNVSGAEKSSGSLANGRLIFRNIPLRLLISEAWVMNPDDVYGPPWLDDVRIDMVAKAASDRTQDSELRLMLQALLKNRMKLAAHIEPRQKSVWALAVWKGDAKMTMSEPPAKPEDADCSRSRTEGSRFRLVCRHETMKAFAHELPQYTGGYVTTTVVDQTGLRDSWDFTLEWTPMQQIESSGGLTFFAALQSQIGLQLRNRKLAVPVLVVDNVERKPADN
jgi:uncharacterized protein (TIGR03435 family)